MALTFKKLENLLIKGKSVSSHVSILLEYSIIKQKLGSTYSHSWYYKKGIESEKERLISLAKDYEKIRKLFNETPIDFFISEINRNSAHISGFDKNAMNAVVYMGFGLRCRQNKFYKELISLRRKTEVLMPMDHYLQYPEEFLKIMD